MLDFGVSHLKIITSISVSVDWRGFSDGNRYLSHELPRTPSRQSKLQPASAHFHDGLDKLGIQIRVIYIIQEGIAEEVLPSTEFFGRL